jgi:phosphatidylserine/phosphatidylglycerophosphate/cardiolipin synthase-like enzyme
MNNRSMRLDTECDVAIDAAVPHNPQAADAIGAFRDSLVGEHLGVSQDAVADAIERTGSLIAAIEALRRPSGRSLRPFEQPDLSAVELWLSENEILDPEGPQEMFEVLTRRSLFRGWRD